jgi:pyruvate dehydrogenase phosphatase regulatory subunit
MVSPTLLQTRIAEWMKRHLPSDNSVQLNEVTSMYTVLLVVGPKSRELLSQLTDTDLRLHPFTYKVDKQKYCPGKEGE